MPKLHFKMTLAVWTMFQITRSRESGARNVHVEHCQSNGYCNLRGIMPHRDLFVLYLACMRAEIFVKEINAVNTCINRSSSRNGHFLDDYQVSDNEILN